MDQKKLQVISNLLRSNFQAFYSMVTNTSFLAMTTIPIGLQNRIYDTFYNYHGVYTAAMEKSKKLEQREGVDYFYERVTNVWAKGVFEAFVAVFEIKLDWTIHDWKVMQIIMEQVFDMRISRRTLLAGSSLPMVLGDQDLSDAANRCDVSTEDLRGRFQTVFKGVISLETEQSEGGK